MSWYCQQDGQNGVGLTKHDVLINYLRLTIYQKRGDAGPREGIPPANPD